MCERPRLGIGLFAYTTQSELLRYLSFVCKSTSQFSNKVTWGQHKKKEKRQKHGSLSWVMMEEMQWVPPFLLWSLQSKAGKQEA